MEGARRCSIWREIAALRTAHDVYEDGEQHDSLSLRKDILERVIYARDRAGPYNDPRLAVAYSTMMIKTARAGLFYFICRFKPTKYRLLTYAINHFLHCPNPSYAYFQRAVVVRTVHVGADRSE